MSQRRYSDRDVAFILKRAVALDEEKAPAETRHGITLPELREIAQEVGIDPAMVNQAAEELNRQGSRTARAVATETAVVKEIRSVPCELGDTNVREALRFAPCKDPSSHSRPPIPGPLTRTGCCLPASVARKPAARSSH